LQKELKYLEEQLGTSRKEKEKSYEAWRAISKEVSFLNSEISSKQSEFTKLERPSIPLAEAIQNLEEL
jgi:hypothetical protein